MMFFFFSSRRRHTRSKRDWSSDVCSSDLVPFLEKGYVVLAPDYRGSIGYGRDRSEERRVGKSVDLGGRRIIKKKKKNKISLLAKKKFRIRISSNCGMQIITIATLSP